MRGMLLGDSIAGLLSEPMIEAMNQAGDIMYVLSNPGTALLGNNLYGFDWRAKIIPMIDEFQPDYFIVCLGTNDAGRNYKNPDYQNAMKLMLDRMGGKPVYWCNVMDKSWNTFWLPYGATEQNWALDDLFARHYAGVVRCDVKAVCNVREDFMADGLHPSRQGAVKMAAGIRYVIGR